MHPWEGVSASFTRSSYPVVPCRARWRSGVWLMREQHRVLRRFKAIVQVGTKSNREKRCKCILVGFCPIRFV